MKTMGISEFKSHALKIINQIAAEKDTLVITKRGKPVARISPYVGNEDSPQPGKLADTLVFEKDIISPLGEEMWDAAK